MAKRWQTEEPLVHERELDIPILFPALGASFHLDPLTPSHQGALAEAHALVLDWIGGALRWTHNSAFPSLEPFRAEDLDYALGFTRLLETRLEGLPPALHLAAINLRASLVQDFSVDCHGAAGPTAGSPYQYRFFGTVGDGPEPRELLPTRAMMRVTVPATWPLDDFRARATALAKILPVRWGNAGLAYAGWELNWYNEVRAGVFAHARRYPGFDMGQYAILMNELHNAMRTVSWLNFLGPELAARVAAAGGVLASTDVVSVWTEGPLTVAQAGPEPEAGDINRLDVPRAYAQADAMLRPARLAPGINFYGPWDDDTTGRWLTRFERRTN